MLFKDLPCIPSNVKTDLLSITVPLLVIMDFPHGKSVKTIMMIMFTMIVTINGIFLNFLCTRKNKVCTINGQY